MTHVSSSKGPREFHFPRGAIVYDLYCMTESYDSHHPTPREQTDLQIISASAYRVIQAVRPMPYDHTVESAKVNCGHGRRGSLRRMHRGALAYPAGALERNAIGGKRAALSLKRTAPSKTSRAPRRTTSWRLVGASWRPVGPTWRPHLCGSLWFSYEFPMVFQWFLMVVLWFSIVSLWFSYGCFMFFYGFLLFSVVFYCFLMVFYGFPWFLTDRESVTIPAQDPYHPKTRRIGFRIGFRG